MSGSYHGQPTRLINYKDVRFAIGFDPYDAANPAQYQTAQQVTATVQRMVAEARLDAEAAVVTLILPGPPTPADLANGRSAVVKNTTNGKIRLYHNDGGTMRSVAFS